MIPIIGKSLHINWDELACKDGPNHTVGTPYPSEFINDGTAHKLSTMFENIRSLFNDKPITILSAFRTIEHNKKIGGATKSQHLFGRALDLKPPVGISIDKFYNTIKEFAVLFKITGIGKYKTFVHVDFRPSSNGRITYWKGIGVKDSKNV